MANMTRLDAEAISEAEAFMSGRLNLQTQAPDLIVTELITRTSRLGTVERLGAAEANLLIRHGLCEGDFLIDIGCGSGRLSSALGHRLPGLRYLGTDIVPALLDYAKARAPSNFDSLCSKS